MKKHIFAIESYYGKSRHEIRDGLDSNSLRRKLNNFTGHPRVLLKSSVIRTWAHIPETEHNGWKAQLSLNSLLNSSSEAKIHLFELLYSKFNAQAGRYTSDFAKGRKIVIYPTQSVHLAHQKKCCCRGAKGRKENVPFRNSARYRSNFTTFPTEGDFTNWTTHTIMILSVVENSVECVFQIFQI